MEASKPSGVTPLEMRSSVPTESSLDASQPALQHWRRLKIKRHTLSSRVR
jgi:hypothetical protein